MAQSQWPVFAVIAHKSTLIIDIFVATSKHALALGEAYMGESLKNSDRSHAIAFWKFCLRALGERATWAEIKEVCQHWNIAKESTFTALHSKEWDLNCVGALLELAKTIATSDDKSVPG